MVNVRLVASVSDGLSDVCVSAKRALVIAGKIIIQVFVPPIVTTFVRHCPSKSVIEVVFFDVQTPEPNSGSSKASTVAHNHVENGKDFVSAEIVLAHMLWLVSEVPLVGETAHQRLSKRLFADRDKVVCNGRHSLRSAGQADLIQSFERGGRTLLV